MALVAYSLWLVCFVLLLVDVAHREVVVGLRAGRHFVGRARRSATQSLPKDWQSGQCNGGDGAERSELSS